MGFTAFATLMSVILSILFFLVNPYLGVLAVLVAIGWAIHLLVKVQRDSGLFWCMKREPFNLQKVACKPCGGLGVVWLHGRQEVIIPPGNRDRQKGKWAWQSRLANAKSCRFCHGMGFVWRDLGPNR